MEARNRSITSPPLVRPHGLPPRGLAMDTRSVLFEGRFGRLFGALQPADYGHGDRDSERVLLALAQAMIHSPDVPEDGEDDEEGGIPSAYTYLGQFIDHDLTFDPASNLMRQNDPDALVDFRTPRFDLDCIYGRGPDDQPYLYDTAKRLLPGALTVRGTAAGTPIQVQDLPRASNCRAIIGDPRNDENVIVSQLQGLFLLFHNRFLDEHPELSFEAVQREVRFHYQWVVTTDFLPRIVSSRVLARVLPHLATRGAPTHVVEAPPRLRFFNPRKEAFIPLEFAAAAYRFGHSMVRPGYRLNDDVPPLPIFPLTTSGTGSDEALDLRGFRAMIETWAIDWARYIDTEPRPSGPKGSAEAELRMQLAYNVDASLADPLANLPDSVAGENPGVFRSLAARNLIRGWRMRLPSGQAVARAMGVAPLADADIRLGALADGWDSLRPITDVAPEFAGNCPLWTYVLAEAAHGFHTAPETELVRTSAGDHPHPTAKLGEVGGTIVAETFGGIMVDDRTSFWNVDPLWRPSLGADGEFTLREFILYALGR